MIARNAKSEPNAYVFLCSQNDQGGYIGVAIPRATCNPSKFNRISISEYVKNDVHTATVIIVVRNRR